MKILCSKSPNISQSTMQGWSDALSDSDFEFIFWDSRKKAIFDAFDENEPDIFISSVEDISRGIVKCIKEYSDTITLFYSPKFDSVLSENIEYMDQLTNDTGKPDYIFSFCHEDRLDEILGGWKNKGYQTISVMKAANTKLYYKRPINSLWGSDISIISDYYGYLTPYILPLCGKMNIRIFGDGWPVSQGVGMPLNENIGNIYASSKIILDISHNTYEPSDVPFNVIVSGGYCISNSVKDVFKSIPNFESPKELHDIIQKYENNTQQSLYTDIINNHTYKHRMKSLLRDIKLNKEANEII